MSETNSNEIEDLFYKHALPVSINPESCGMIHERDFEHLIEALTDKFHIILKLNDKEIRKQIEWLLKNYWIDQKYFGDIADYLNDKYYHIPKSDNPEKYVGIFGTRANDTYLKWRGDK